MTYSKELGLHLTRHGIQYMSFVKKGLLEHEITYKHPHAARSTWTQVHAGKSIPIAGSHCHPQSNVLILLFSHLHLHFQHCVALTSILKANPPLFAYLEMKWKWHNYHLTEHNLTDSRDEIKIYQQTRIICDSCIFPVQYSAISTFLCSGRRHIA